MPTRSDTRRPMVRPVQEPLRSLVDAAVRPHRLFRTDDPNRPGWALLLVTAVGALLACAANLLLLEELQLAFGRIIPARGAQAAPWVWLFSLVSIPATVGLTALLLWILTQLSGAELRWMVALHVAVLAYVPRMLGEALGLAELVLQGPVEGGTAGFGLARWVGTESVGPLAWLFVQRLELFLLWSTGLIALGVYRRTEMGRLDAAGVALVIWLAGTLPLALGAAQGGP